MGLSKNPYNEEGHPSTSRKIWSYPLYALLPVIFIHFYFSPFSVFSVVDRPPSTNSIIVSSSSPPTSQEIMRKNTTKRTPCEYTKGEWIPTKLKPLYNGTTCDTIKQGQNCVVFGRPDSDYLHWRWKPKHCNLPRFNPGIFLNLLENRHVAFVGDSLARNQLESLLCMLATESKPELYYTNGEDNKFRKWYFPEQNVNVSLYWSPFLVKGIEKTDTKNYNTLFLDSVSEVWADDVEGFDVLVLSAGHWYLHPAVYSYNNTVLGCHYRENCTEIGFYDVFGSALKTTFESIIRRKGWNGNGNGNEKEKGNGNGITVFLTTFSPAHFDGEWDKLGACPKTMPYKESEQILEGMNEEMRRVGVEKVEEGRLLAKNLGDVNVRIEMLDITKMALMRPDGHPGPYMNPFPFQNGVSDRVQNDCVHWCLPGPIDAWNEILLALILRLEGEHR